MPVDRPNIDQLARDALDDLGLVFDDNTRPSKHCSTTSAKSVERKQI
jgi:hypothetical protein